jgi:hypothetical protein
MRAIVAQLQQHRPPVSTLRELCALTRYQLTEVQIASEAASAFKTNAICVCLLLLQHRWNHCLHRLHCSASKSW